MDPWDKLGTGATLRRGPPRVLLSKDTSVGNLKTSPEVVEHMVEDLEDRLKHYFNLYVKEKKDREIEQEKNVLLMEKLKQLSYQLDLKDKRLCELEHKIKVLFINPQNIKETLDRIDLIYIHLDTLIQAFIGIGTCATLNGLNKNIFTKIALEYLHPCKNLDSRLDALYSALYSLLLTSNTNEGFFGQSNTATLEGFHINISELLFDTNTNYAIPTQIQFGLRYDHEEPIPLTTYDVVNGLCNIKLEKHLNLPPKKPGKIPKFVIDIWFESTNDMASARVSLIDPILLQQLAPWPLMVNDVKIGYVKVTVNPYPINARMPAERFKTAKEFAHVQKGARPIIDYHLLQPPVTNEPNTKPNNNIGFSKSIVTIKVDQDDDKPNTSKPNTTKPNTPFVPKKQPLRKPVTKPVPRKPTPLKPKDDSTNGGIIKTIIESQPEKVISIESDIKENVDGVVKDEMVKVDIANDKIESTSEFEVHNEEVNDEEVNVVAKEVDNKVEADNVEATNVPNLNVVEDKIDQMNVDESSINVDNVVEESIPKVKITPPKIIIEKKLSTKLSMNDSNEVIKKPLPDPITPTKINLDVTLTSEKVENKPKLTPLIPLAQPVVLTKKPPV